MANEYRENNVYLLMGCEYTYENAGQNFKKMDLILNYIRENYKDINMNFLYSTPSEYVAAIKAEKH